MTALNSLSKDLGVSYFIDGSGKMQVYTASGQSLLDSTNTVHTLSHTSAASVSSSTVYSSTGTSGFDGITVSGTDITDQITSGKIGALIDQRDTVWPDVQSELDNLASTLATTINSISNLGSADPPPNSLTGSTTVATGDAVTVASGTTIRVAITDSAGDVTSTQDVDISGATTVGDIATDLASAGLTATVTNGHLVISAPTGSGVALSTLSGSVGGTNLSQYFGLNDLVSNGSSAMTIAVRSDIAADPSLIPTGEMSSTLTVGSAAIGASSAAIINELADSLTNSQSFSAAGALGATSSSLSGYAASIISDIATKSSNASTAKTTTASTLTTLQTSFSDQSGVNTDDETANLTALQNAYAASAQVITAVKAMFSSLMTAVQA
jgi:flagellar hook-associated protein 1 FlgK